jgi:type II secretory pathway component PulF
MADKNVDLCVLFRAIKQYTAAGISLVDAVEEYAKDIEKPSLKIIISTVLNDMKNGMYFSTALKKHPSFFPAFIAEIINVGEESGQIQKILDEIVFYLEQEIELKCEVNAALLAPKIFFVGMILAFSGAIFYIIPQMGAILIDMKVELPLITRFVLGTGNIMQSFWWLFALLAIGAYAALRYFQKEYPAESDFLKLKIPFLGEINRIRIQYRFAKIFGLCTMANIPTAKALEYTAIASDNAAMKNMLLLAAQDVNNVGMTISNALKKANDGKNLLNKNIYILLQVGIRAGNISDIMMREAEQWSKELLSSSKLIGDKIGLSVTIPGYIALIILFASIEYPVVTVLQNLGNVEGGM